MEKVKKIIKKAAVKAVTEANQFSHDFDSAYQSPDPVPEMPIDPADSLEIITDSDADAEEIQQRTDDIEQLAGDFILDLCGLRESLDIGDMLEPESLTSFIESVECLLWEEFGIDIYRPRTIVDKSGVEHVVHCITEELEFQ